MNVLRIWILRLVSVVAGIYGAYFLYESHEDFAWRQAALSEAIHNGSTYWEVNAESETKESHGREAMHDGIALISVALLMSGLASLLRNKRLA
jgi:hypothetical protein